MGTLDRILTGLRQVILMESKLQRLADGVDEITDVVTDHEKRLIRLETMLEIAEGRLLPPP